MRSEKHMPRTTSSTISSILAACTLALILATGVAAQATEKVLYTFTGGNDGGAPEAGLTSDGKGNFFGTTQIGGSSGFGAVFELSPGPNGTWTEQAIYSFSFNNNDGFDPWGGVVFDSKGNLYGTTLAGGTSFQGTVYQLSPGSGGIWTEKIIYNFAGGSDASFAVTTLVFDKAGNLYGTSDAGGAFGFGTVFQLVPGSNGTWTEKVNYSFTGGNDGAYPYGGSLVVDANGNLYGVAPNGGIHDYGVVFELLPGSSGNWTQKVLYAFEGGAAGSSPIGSLVFDSAGNLFGASAYSIFELSPGSNGVWTQKAIHNFKGGNDGAYPEAGLIFDKSGSLFGTTNAGGNHRGTVFSLTPSSNGVWTERVLHRFAPSGGDGIFPAFCSLALDGSGNLYGTTPQGGTSNLGVVFEVTP
jgi:uncharacterized repeat protein (TIGR03803 family)